MRITYVAISPDSVMSKYDEDELEWALRYALERESYFAELRKNVSRELMKRTIDRG